MELVEGNSIKTKVVEKKNKLMEGRWADLENKDTDDEAAEISEWWR